jgi:hypothetical protein
LVKVVKAEKLLRGTIIPMLRKVVRAQFLAIALPPAAVREDMLWSELTVLGLHIHPLIWLRQTMVVVEERRVRSSTGLMLTVRL